MLNRKTKWRVTLIVNVKLTACLMSSRCSDEQFKEYIFTGIKLCNFANENSTLS